MRFLYPLLAIGVLAASPALAQTSSADSASAGARSAANTRTSLFAPSDKPNFIPVPVAFYQQETGFAGGAAVLPVWRFGTDTTVRKSNARLIAWFSQKKQSTIQLTHTIFTPGERFYFSGELSRYDQKLFYYGIGNETSTSRESELTYKLLIFDEKALARVGDNLFAGVRYRLTNTTDIEPQGTDDEGRPNYFLVDPRLTARERQNTFVSGVGPSVLYDGRDNVLATYRGNFLDAHVLFHGSGLGSDYRFTRYQLDARHFRPLFGSTNTILALNLIGQFHSGAVPFREMGGMGQNLGGALFNNAAIMRGIYESRFRDRQTVVFQGEIRQKLFWRFDGAVFAGVGEVGNRMSDLELDKTKIAAGAGLRFRFNRRDRLNIRLDYAGGSNTPGSIYFAVGEAF
ncbi:outer membrane protein assembly factor [Hymenobacter weizhouensis]|uniref:outer membrane protein assembly factor n=1 Tax=Hymenobacter sp. YIM 151500-1 TaxID=2987689 RepID=UPI002226033A|nr:outer membrane protein assembly factor [Hymenobacter sp. YIM 151500-1]UYZ61701.1 outer membrane protein assembly factor [Hymenobacter sp. YIM 151500-1]